MREIVALARPGASLITLPRRDLDPRLEPFMEQLKDLLYEKRLKLAEVERRVPMSSKYLSKLLTGKVEMKLVHLYDVLAVAGVEPRDFFCQLCAKMKQPAELERRLEREAAAVRRGSDDA